MLSGLSSTTWKHLSSLGSFLFPLQNKLFLGSLPSPREPSLQKRSSNFPDQMENLQKKMHVITISTQSTQGLLAVLKYLKQVLPCFFPPSFLFKTKEIDKTQS